MACESNETCETLRSGHGMSGRQRLVPLNSEDASPNKVNSFRPRYTKLSLASLPEMVKPATDMEVTNICTYQSDRGEWRERASKDLSQHWEGLYRGTLSEVGRGARMIGKP